MKTLTAGGTTGRRGGSGAGMAPSRLSEKLASRNGPRHSVYWVQCRKTEDPLRSASRSSDMAANAGHVEYSVTGKYTGDWLDGQKHGYGVFEYANGSKYEGEWVNDQRCGKGTFWVEEKKQARKQYAGEWADDKRQGRGTFFFADGGRYDGEWLENKRDGTGRMIYGKDHSIYEGQWENNVRSGHGVLQLPNGDRYDGHWLNDKKEGPGRFHYKATRKVYEGEWVDDAPKCGTYHDEEAYSGDNDDDDGAGREKSLKAHDRFQLPELGLAHPERVVSESIAYIRQERLLEKTFDHHHQEIPSAGEGDEFDELRTAEMATGDDDAPPSRRRGEPAHHGPEGGSVVFDEDTMQLLQDEFRTMEDRNGTIRCMALPSILASVGLSIEEEHLVAFLDEIGANGQTVISFAECVDIVSLLAESAMDAGAVENGADQEDGDEEDED